MDTETNNFWGDNKSISIYIRDSCCMIGRLEFIFFEVEVLGLKQPKGALYWTVSQPSASIPTCFWVPSCTKEALSLKIHFLKMLLEVYMGIRFHCQLYLYILKGKNEAEAFLVLSQSPSSLRHECQEQLCRGGGCAVQWCLPNSQRAITGTCSLTSGFHWQSRLCSFNSAYSFLGT